MGTCGGPGRHHGAGHRSYARKEEARRVSGPSAAGGPWWQSGFHDGASRQS
jgi:hypothetical protein